MTSQLASAIRPLERGGTFTRTVIATLSTLLLLTMLMPALASPARAQAVPGERAIEVFYGRDMVLITGYDPGSTVRIEVVRNDAPVGAVTRTVLPDGTYEVNHTGAAANDCWDMPNTPDIKPGDIVRTTVLELADGTQPQNDVNETVVRDVYLDLSENGLVADEGEAAVDGDGKITVKGHVKSVTGAEIDFGRGDVVGIGLRKENRDSPWGDGQDGRKVLNAELTAADIGEGGNFTYTFRDIVEEDIEDVQTNGVAQSIEWTPAVVEPATPSELTVYDANEGVPAGCPPLEGGPAEVTEPAPNVNQDLGPNANLSAPIEEGRTMEVVHGIEFVLLHGYPANAEVRVDVVRGKGANAVVVGSTTQRTDGTGLLEINHLGAGQFPDGDCWDYPGTPDIRPGDVVMATVLGAQGGETSDVDTTVVRDVSLSPEVPEVVKEDGQFDRLIVSGHIGSTDAAPITAGDVLEIRLNKNNRDNLWSAAPSVERPDRKDLRGNLDVSAITDANNRVNGDFTHEFIVTDEDADDVTASGVEMGIEWAPAIVEPEEPREITVFNGSDLESLGCPPHLGGTPAVTPDTANAITGSSHKYVNAANQAQGTIDLSGVSYGKDQVKVTVADSPEAVATPVPVDPAAPNGLQTWRASVNLDLGSLPQSAFTASATFVNSEAAASDPVASDTAEMMKDTELPAVPEASVAEGTYPGAQRVALRTNDPSDRVYYSTTVNDPDTGQPITDTLYLSPIQVNESQTITAVAVDKAGNASEGRSSYSYTIVPPPNALPTITDVSPADGTTVRNKRATVAATVSDAETNLSRNDIRLTIRGENIRTFSYNRATDRLTYTPRKNFSVGATPVRIVAVDENGGRARADWTFTVRR